MVSAEPNVQAVAPGTILPMQAAQPIRAATYQQKRYIGQTLIPEADLLVASGPERRISILDTRLQWLMSSMNDVIGTDAIQSSGAGAQGLAVEGMLNIVDNVTSSGGIGPSDLAQWASFVQSTQQSIVTALKPINDLFLAVTIGADMPTIAVTTTSILGAMWQGAQQMQRFVGEDEALIGYTVLGFNQRPVVVDAGIPENVFLWLNEKYIKLYVHTDDRFKVKTIETLPDQDASLHRRSVTLCFTTTARRMHAKHTNLVTT